MGKARTLLFGSVVGAAVGVVLAPRFGESRRAALGRLRLAVRPGRGAVAAFAGTPCSLGGPEAVAVDERPDDVVRPTTGGADDGG